MDIIGWLWWAISSLLSALLSVLWFLLSGWVSTVLQVALLVGVVYALKYGWRRAPIEIWRRTRSFGRFFWGWLRARETKAPIQASEQLVRIVKSKEFGDINISTLLSLLMLAGLMCAARL
jgi:hypothetical protein